MVGGQEIEWETLATVAKLAASANPHGAYKAFGMLDSLRAYRNDVTIMGLVGSFCQHGCADSRDKVYGLYGLIANIDTSWPTSHRIDYAKSAWTLYTEFCSNMVVTSMENETRLTALDPESAIATVESKLRLTMRILLKLGRAMGFSKELHPNNSVV